MRPFVQTCFVGLLVIGVVPCGSLVQAEEPSAAELRRQQEVMVAKATSFLLTKGRAQRRIL